MAAKHRGKSIFNIFRRSAELKNVTPEGMNGTVVPSVEPVRLDSSELALTLSTVYRCAAFLSDSVAKLPLLVERNRGGIFRAEDTPLARLVRLSPNEYTGAFDFWRQTVFNMLFQGEAYIIPIYGTLSSCPLRLVLCGPGTAARTALGRYLVNDTEQGIRGEFEEANIVRIKWKSLNGIDGVSVIRYASTTMSIAGTADRNTLDTFASGGTTMGFITNESGVPGYGEYQTGALEDMAAEIARGIRRKDRVVAIGGKADYHNFSMTAADMQALETRKFTVREICRFFGVHPSFVFDDTSLNYKSAENAYSSFLSDTLQPILVQIETELNRKLFVETQFGKRRFRFAADEMFAADPESRVRYIGKRIETGTMTPNEARAAMGMLPVEGGDVPLISANLRPLGEIPAQANTEPDKNTDDNKTDNNDEQEEDNE